jgi:replicative DNA helicase
MDLEAKRIYKEAVSLNNRLANFLDSDNFTIEGYNKLIAEAKDLAIDLDKKEPSNVETIFNIIDKHSKAKRGEITGLALGYAQLNGVVLLEPCDVMLVGGRPAMGKTAYGVSTAVRLALSGKKVLYFSLEMSKEQILRRVISNITGIDSNKIKYGLCSDREINTIYSAQALAELNNLIVIEGSKTINEISTLVSKYKSEVGIDVYIIDYIQKIQATTNRGRYEAVTEISNGVKLITMGSAVPCIALAQLSRDSSRTGKRPSLPDLKESGELEQDASIVAFIHRPEYYGETETYNGLPSTNACEFIIGKNREGEIGIYDFNVNLSTSKFT